MFERVCLSVSGVLGGLFGTILAPRCLQNDFVGFLMDFGWILPPFGEGKLDQQSINIYDLFIKISEYMLDGFCMNFDWIFI